MNTNLKSNDDMTKGSPINRKLILLPKNSILSAKKFVINGTLLNTYCETIIKQQHFLLGGSEKLINAEGIMNSSLDRMKSECNNYKKTVNPRVEKNIENLSNFITLLKDLSHITPESLSTTEWTTRLYNIQHKCIDYKKYSFDTKIMLESFNRQLKSFQSSTGYALQTLSSEIDYNREKIDEYMTTLENLNKQKREIEIGLGFASLGTVIAVVLIIGGIAVIAVSAATGGSSAPLGVSIIIGGVVLFLSSGGALGVLSNEISYIAKEIKKTIEKKGEIKDGIRVLSTVLSMVKDIDSLSMNCSTAAIEVMSDWTTITSNLGRFLGEIKDGRILPNEARILFLDWINENIQSFEDELRNLRSHFTTTQNQDRSKDRSVVELYDELCKSSA